MVDKRSELMDMANDIKIIGKTETIRKSNNKGRT